MIQRKELFVNYEEFDKPQKVGMGDGHTVEACGRGDIHFTMTLENGKPRSVTMCNALYAPKLTCNLFSVRATVMKGNTVKFKIVAVGFMTEMEYYWEQDYLWTNSITCNVQV